MAKSKIAFLSFLLLKYPISSFISFGAIGGYCIWEHDKRYKLETQIKKIDQSIDDIFSKIYPYQLRHTILGKEMLTIDEEYNILHDRIVELKRKINEYKEDLDDYLQNSFFLLWPASWFGLKFNREDMRNYFFYQDGCLSILRILNGLIPYLAHNEFRNAYQMTIKAINSIKNNKLSYSLNNMSRLNSWMGFALNIKTMTIMMQQVELPTNKEYEGIITDLDESAILDPYNPYTPHLRIEIIRRYPDGDQRAAERSYEVKVYLEKFESQNVDLRIAPIIENVKGNFYRRNGEFNKALSFFKNALNYDPKNAAYLYNIASVLIIQYQQSPTSSNRYLLIGNDKGAEYYLNKALDMRPGDDAIMCLLGITKALLGSKQDCQDAEKIYNTLQGEILAQKIPANRSYMNDFEGIFIQECREKRGVSQNHRKRSKLASSCW